MQMVEKKATEKDMATSVLLCYNGKKVHDLREEHHPVLWSLNRLSVSSKGARQKSVR